MANFTNKLLFRPFCSEDHFPQMRSDEGASGHTGVVLKAYFSDRKSQRLYGAVSARRVIDGGQRRRSVVVRRCYSRAPQLMRAAPTLTRLVLLAAESVHGRQVVSAVRRGQSVSQ